MDKGLFITFEGIDGVGKSTQLNMVYEKLVGLGYCCLKTHEPGGTKLGFRIRQILLDPTIDNMAENTEALLYAADRAQHVQTVIKPALSQNKIVICDRYLDSSIAYQGYGLERDLELIQSVNHWAVSGVMPDLTLCLDLDPEIALTRTDGDRIEQRALSYYRRVRSGYHQIARENPERFILVDAAGSLDQVFTKIWGLIQGRVSDEIGCNDSSRSERI